MESARSFARRSLALAVSLATAGLLATVPSGTAHAAPTPAEIDRQVRTLGAKLNAINEQYNDARVLLAASKAKQAQLDKQIQVYKVKTDAYEEQVGRIGASAYRGGRPSALTVLLSGGSPDAVLEQLAVLDILSRDQRGTIEGLLAAKKPLDEAKRKLDREVAAQAAQEKRLRDAKAALNRDYTTWTRLKAQQTPRASRTTTRTPVYDGAASGRGATVVKYAYAQLGDPYVFGAAGPDSFDCSGLTLAAWSQVGVSLPHSARQQYANEPKVSQASLQPGDLVFFYSPIGHNGIYVGGGKMIHAPTPGENVQLSDMTSEYWQNAYAGAVRPS